MSEARVLTPWPPPLRVVKDSDRHTSDSHGDDAPYAPVVLRWRADGEPGRCRVEGDTVTIGASPANVIAVDDPRVSAFHCRLFRRSGGRLWVADVGSRNGTRLDGTRISEAEVQPGSTIRVGDLDIRVERELAAARAPSLPGFVAEDPVLAPVLELLARAAPSVVPILLLGESGCGKEVAARAVHDLSARAQGPFVPLNCGAISAELAESELFGHERGAFTGAVGSSPGAFGAAEGGTLFLDEIGDLPGNLQVKLLRALESREVKPVGAARPRQADVRIVCATARDLRAMVRRGEFREDLYFRIAGLLVELPPLRARKLDILPLADRFVAEAAEGGRRCTLSPDAREALLQHRWPGNVRELRNVVRTAVLLSDSPTVRRAALRFDDALALDALPARAESAPLIVSEPHAPGRAEDWIDTRGKTLEEIEALAIRASFARHKGNRKAMMAELGLSKSGLLRKLDALGLRGGREEGTEKGEP